MLSLIGVLLLSYTLIRFLFYFSNLNFFQDIRGYELFWAFLLGLRFDLTVLVQINAVFILLGAFPAFIFHTPYAQIFLKLIFVIFNAFFLFLSLVNIQFFPFQQQHLSKAVFYILTDILRQWETFLFEYWWVLLFVLFILYILYQLYGRCFRFFFPKTPKPSAWPVQILFIFFVLLSNLVISRGGFQAKVLNMTHAQVLGSYKSSLLVLNAPFTFIHSFSQDLLEEKHYFQNNKELRKYLDSETCQKTSLVPKKARNVVLIIIESFGAEFLSIWKPPRVYTPSFDRLIAEGGALFANAYANAKRSIESLPPLLASLPNWMALPLVKTAYINKNYFSLAHILKKRNYRTLFLHGGLRGTMYFDLTAPFLGLDEYYGYEDFAKYAEERQIPKKIYDDKVWGVFDEPFFLYTIDMINKDTQKPFFAVLFSLSSHHPYSIPEKYANHFSEGETPFYKSIAYTDHALGLFFAKIKKQSWAKDTLFVITADHTPSTNHVWSKNFLSRRRIPILFYQPGRSLTFMKTSRLAQQLDIFPTVLDLLNVNLREGEALLPFGTSLLAACRQRHVVLFEDPNYWLVTDKEALRASNELQNSVLFQFQNGAASQKSSPSLELKELKAKGRQQEQRKQTMQRYLQAYIQYYNNGLLYNKLILDSPAPSKAPPR